MKAQEPVVSYFYDEEIGNYCYGGGNPMRPHRARMAYSLVDSYGLTQRMLVHRPRPREFEELTEFHADEYINFLRGVTPNTVDENMTQLRRFNLGIAGEADCPVFDGLYEYCQVYAGGSVDGAAQLAREDAEIAFNWSGGMHHAKKAEASGFCYVNDIVMAILELLKSFQRVLYVDIDIHHGDGVEEAFYLTDRVMTVSFHKYGEFFPGTGALGDIGYAKGRYYTVNVPLKDGMDDDSYKLLYEPIMQRVMEMYQPGAIVMCCGADSLSGDRLGCFNLSIEGHSHCLEFLRKFNVPMLILGGGGYTLRNVARCWCYETGRMMNNDLPDNLPDAALAEFNMYLDTQRLRIAVSNMKNANQREELEQIKVAVLEHLSLLPPVPSAAMSHVPPLMGRKPELPEADPDVRGGGQVHDEMRRGREGDESDEEEERPGARREVEYVGAAAAAAAGGFRASPDGPGVAAGAGGSNGSPQGTGGGSGAAAARPAQEGERGTSATTTTGAQEQQQQAEYYDQQQEGQGQQPGQAEEAAAAAYGAAEGEGGAEGYDGAAGDVDMAEASGAGGGGGAGPAPASVYAASSLEMSEALGNSGRVAGSSGGGAKPELLPPGGRVESPVGLEAPGGQQASPTGGSGSGHAGSNGTATPPPAPAPAPAPEGMGAPQ